MESLDALLKELNKAENEYQIVHQQYTELKSIISYDNDLRCLATTGNEEENVSSSKTIKTGRTSKSKSISKIPDDDTNKIASAEHEDINYKKLVKNRIKHFHTIMGNVNSFRADNTAKNTFLNNLALSNEAILEKEKNVPSVQQFLNSFQK